jgi:hypothetical protein
LNKLLCCANNAAESVGCAGAVDGTAVAEIDGWGSGGTAAAGGDDGNAAADCGKRLVGWDITDIGKPCCYIVRGTEGIDV